MYFVSLGPIYFCRLQRDEDIKIPRSDCLLLIWKGKVVGGLLAAPPLVASLPPLMLALVAEAVSAPRCFIQNLNINEEILNFQSIDRDIHCPDIGQTLL